MVKSTNLNNAKNKKKDEFYTQYKDIEKELIDYKKYFKNKTIYCNCDNPEFSNFWKYFIDNFIEFGLKELISTYISNNKSYCTIKDKNNINKILLKDDGDFRSQECIDLLNYSDIIITNTPFSLYREYVEQLMKYNKKFIILGNMNSMTYKNLFAYIRDNKIWLGKSIHSGDIEFQIPDNYDILTDNNRIDKNENKFVKVTSIRWFTNLNYDNNINKLILTKKYNSKDYPKYDDYDAINVNKTKDIPYDYNGLMGVPITFLDKYNSEQFKIIGLDRYVEGRNKCSRFHLNNKEMFARIIIKKL